MDYGKINEYINFTLLFTKYSTALHDEDIRKTVRDFWKMLMALKN